MADRLRTSTSSSAQPEAAAAAVIPGVVPRAIPKPAVINVAVADVAAAVRFYSGVLGIPLARSVSPELSYHAPVSSDGVMFTVTQQRFPGETTTVFYAVEDLAGAIAAVTAHGGTVVAGPYELAMPDEMMPVMRADFVESPFARSDIEPSIGQAVTVHDPEGTRFGLIEFAGWVHPSFCVGEFRKPVTADQLVDHNLALRRHWPTNGHAVVPG